jgi:hypothetical protein
MAQIAKTAPTTPAANAAGPRVAAGVRNVATVDRAPVEEISPKTGASFDDAAFLFQEFARGGVPGRRQGQGPAIPTPGMIRATSQAFAAFLEFEGSAQSSAGLTEAAGKAASPTVVSRAINVYETNARVIGGGMVRLGSSLSMTL